MRPAAGAVMAAEKFRFAPPYELPHWPAPPRPSGAPRHHEVVIVGGGLSGLTLACDLAQRGVAAVVLDDDDTVGARGASSRGIVYAQKSLEVFERLGIYQRIAAKGTTWSVGKTFSGAEIVYGFNLQNSSVSTQPPFINLQQFYIEWFLVDRIMEVGQAELRWKHRCAGITERGDHVEVQVDAPDGAYTLRTRFLVDASGAKSTIREQLQLDTHPSRSTDRWCISDVRFSKPLPTERHTWIDAPFNEGRAVWQHLMGDGVWRMDFQMDEHADPQSVSRPEVAGSRLREQLGPGVEFEFVWIGPYQYRDHLLDQFRHGNIFFVGDSAHVVSPFGARGGNSGIQDANNLGWKLALVLGWQAGEALLDSYHAERHPAAKQNLEVTSRTARFLAPRSAAEHLMRRAVLGLAREHGFARGLVNAGRMSVANEYAPSPWLPQGGRTVQNLALRDAGGGSTSLMQLLRGGTRWLGLCFEPAAGEVAAAAQRLRSLPIDLLAVGGPEAALYDERGLLARHLGAQAGNVALVRPDAYLAAVESGLNPQRIAELLQRGLAALTQEHEQEHD